MRIFYLPNKALVDDNKTFLPTRYRERHVVKEILGAIYEQPWDNVWDSFGTKKMAYKTCKPLIFMVGPGGFEPPTSTVSR